MAKGEKGKTLMQTNSLISGVRQMFAYLARVHLAPRHHKLRLRLRTARALPQTTRRETEKDAAVLRAAGLFQLGLTETEKL